MIFNKNGKIATDLPESAKLKNSASSYGFSLIETILVINGQIQQYDYHCRRLWHGMQVLLMAPPDFTESSLAEEILKTVNANNISAVARVRVKVFCDGEFNFFFGGGAVRFTITCMELTENEHTYFEEGWLACMADGLKKATGILSGLKTGSALLYSMAAQIAFRNSCHAAFITNDAGNIVESAVTNVFWVKDSEIFTPPLSEGCVAGTMRQFILDNRKDILEKPLTMDALLDADEVFLTNAIVRIKWIGNFAGRSYTNDASRALYHSLFS